MTYKTLAFDPDTCLEKELRGTADLELRTARSRKDLLASVRKSSPDLLVLDVHATDLAASDFLADLRKYSPLVPAILIVDDTNRIWEQVLDPLIDLIRSPISQTELVWRIKHLMSRAAKREKPKSPYESRVQIETVLSFRNEKSGRLDAALIAKAFGMTLADVGRIVDRSRAAIHKTPDAASLQKNLYSFERLASAIKQMTGSVQPALKLWLNTPNKAFPNELPIDIIKQGHMSMLADMLENALLGHPD